MEDELKQTIKNIEIGQKIFEKPLMPSESDYDYCPICGQKWGKYPNNPKSHKCDKMLLIDKKKPHFYMIDINNYNEDFLKDIIVWQELKIRALQNINSIHPSEVGLKK